MKLEYNENLKPDTFGILHLARLKKNDPTD
jgi:hypothetical protein